MTTEQNILKDKIFNTVSGSGLPEKVFVARDSYFREISKNALVRSLYYIFGAQVITVLVCMLVEDITADESEITTISVLKNGLQGFHFAILLWFVLFTLTLLSFWVFQLWANIRIQINNKRFLKLWDSFWFVCVPCYYVLVLYLANCAIQYINFRFMLSFIMMVETVRLLMKTHSFIRSSAAEIIAYKPHSDMMEPKKKFSSFFYFMFCPTLLYKDEFPRTPKIRWAFVGNCLIELIVSGVILTYLFKSLILQPLAQFGITPYAWKEYLVIFFRFTMAGPLFMLLLFGFTLDSWQNLFAELTTFADRLFYKDWWNSTDYLRFYKTWNVIVHDWLYEYVYKDMYIHVAPGNQLIAKAAVFFLSALFHELIITVSIRMICPFLFVLFFFVGTAMTLVKVNDSYIWHVLFIFGNCIGDSMLIIAYTLAYKVKHGNSAIG